jgi:ribosomal protein L13E
MTSGGAGGVFDCWWSGANCLSRAPAPLPIMRPSERVNNGRRVDLSQHGRGFSRGLLAR